MTDALRTCVVLFVDISGSSRLYQELGDAVAHQRVRDGLAVLRDVIEARSGRVIKNIGDGLLCEFAEADAALIAAEAMQLAIEHAGAGRDPKLGIHVGCHLGPVIDTAGDLFGDTVNIAARIMEIAHEGQIVITQATAARLSEPLQRNVRLLRGVTVKGRRDAVTAMDYVWRQHHGDFTVEAPAAAAASSRLTLRSEGREFCVERSGLSTINLGRGADCHIIVIDPETSRLHATIEVRGDKFVLVDHSSNGTYVTWDGAPETCLKREEMILPGRGRIALGLSTSAAHATLVEFLREQNR
jgi:class 3 adenylate cyclase